jgi:hypothetical protein
LATANIVKECPECEKSHVVCGIPMKEFIDYKTRPEALIQDVLPSLSADAREVVKTGICPPCWEDLFSA